MIKMIKVTKFWDLFFSILVIFCVISIFNTSFKVGVFYAFVMVLYVLRMMVRIRKVEICDCIVILFAFWSLFSYLWETGSNALTYYVYGIVYSVMPICFYFYAKELSSEQAEKVTTLIIRTIRASMILGLVLYIFAPRFYAEFLYSHLLIPNTGLYQVRKMFQSIFGVTISASLLTFWALYEWHGFLENKRKHWFFLVLSGVLLAMTARKSAIFVFFIVVVLESLVSKRVKNNFGKRALLIILLLLGALFAMESFFPTLYYEIMGRFSLENIILGVTQRREARTLTLHNLNNYLLGNGVGSSGHRAGMENTISLYAYDNSYLLLLCEVGIVGLLLFALIIGYGLYSGYKKKVFRLFEVEVVFILVLQSWTSNMFEFIYITPLFWYFLGRCCKRLDNTEIEEKIS